MSRSTYTELWNSSVTTTTWTSIANRLVDKIIAHKNRYDQVQKMTNVPWNVVAAIHALESTLDFGTWLANGDTLKTPTVRIPAGLGKGMTFPISWENGAYISLGVVPKEDFDTIEKTLGFLEAYNGMGYVTHDINSPYLWSGTQHYKRGKYITDGVWDSAAVSAQVGCVPLLKELELRTTVGNRAAAGWFDIQRNAYGVTTITAFAGSVAIDQLTSNWKSEILAFLTKHNQASSILCAPANKPLPILTGLQSRTLNEKLSQFYAVKTNYDRVYVDVMSWYGTTSNACVAFMSTALRMIGYNVPKTTTARGENISLVTTPFSNWLVSQGWKRIALTDLQPGDVCFSIETEDPGYPSHTYMFVSWQGKLDTALVVDNQGFTHVRNMVDTGPKDPFDYALRAPM